MNRCLAKGFGEGREVSFRKRFDRNPPDTPPVPAWHRKWRWEVLLKLTLPRMLLVHPTALTVGDIRILAERLSLPFEPIFLGFGEKEQIIEIGCESVFYRRGHAVGFVPDDRIPQNPSSIDHFDGEAMGNEAQGFFRKFRGSVPWMSQASSRIGSGCSSISFVVAGTRVCVTEVDPTRARLF